ncbi:hypothetical protein [Cohnella sp.]|uniref:hypothetical protein n=1 Tax=Cohnella sp. TaxID=1883426 RepID=UPI0035694F37
MKIAFSRIAWGLALALIDVTINGFDLLPDVVGYGLLMAGLAKLVSRNRMYKLAWNAAAVQLILSVLALLGLTRSGFSLTGGIEPSLNALALTAAGLAIELAMLYGLCEGIRLDALERNKERLARSARNRRHFAFASGAGMLFQLPFQLNQSLQEMLPFVILLALCVLFAWLSIVALARQAGREIAGNPGSGGGGLDGGEGSVIDVRM